MIATRVVWEPQKYTPHKCLKFVGLRWPFLHCRVACMFRRIIDYLCEVSDTSLFQASDLCQRLETAIILFNTCSLRIIHHWTCTLFIFFICMTKISKILFLFAHLQYLFMFYKARFVCELYNTSNITTVFIHFNHVCPWFLSNSRPVSQHHCIFFWTCSID